MPMAGGGAAAARKGLNMKRDREAFQKRNASRELKGVAGASTLVDQMTPQQYAEVRKAFESYDKDGSGVQSHSTQRHRPGLCRSLMPPRLDSRATRRKARGRGDEGGAAADGCCNEREGG